MPGQHSEAVCKRRMTGEGPYCRDIHRERVRLSECAVDLAAGSLEVHLHTQHIIVWGPQWTETLPLADIQVYQVLFTRTVGSVEFPVKV